MEVAFRKIITYNTYISMSAIQLALKVLTNCQLEQKTKYF